MRTEAFPLHIAVLWIISLASFSKATQFGSVSFFESSPGTFFRNGLQGGTFSYADVSAATVVLLGSAPPASISDESAFKLDELLVPNPFRRPHAVLMLTLEQSKAGGKMGLMSVQQRDLQLETKRATLVLPEDAALISWNSTPVEDLESALSDENLQELAFFLGGSYERNDEPSKGMLSFDLPSGDMLILDLEKKVHQALALELLSIYEHTKDAAVAFDKGRGGLVSGTLAITTESSDSSLSSEDLSDLLHLVTTRVFSHLDSAINGGLVGVIVHAQEQILDLNSSWGLSRLQLLQASSDTLTAAAAEILTETIIAYIMGILFIVALIIGTCLLLKMPLTRDTLLYSGVKLD